MTGKSFTREVAVHSTALIIAYSVAGLATMFGLVALIQGGIAEGWIEARSIGTAIWRGLNHEYPIPPWVFIPTPWAIWALTRNRPVTRSNVESTLLFSAELPAVAPAKDSAPLLPNGERAVPNMGRGERVFTANEEVVLRWLAAADGEKIFENALAVRAGIPRLRTTQALDSLRDAGYVDESWYDPGRHWGLTARGRDLVIEKGFVPETRTPTPRRG